MGAPYLHKTTFAIDPSQSGPQPLDDQPFGLVP